MRICLLLERPLDDPGTPVLRELVEDLRSRGCSVATMLPSTDFVDLRRLDVDCDLYVSKACNDLLLSLTAVLADRGARIVNSFGSSSYLRDKGRVTAALMEAAIPVPETCIAGSARLASQGLGGCPIIVKPVRGVWGEGIEIARDAADLDRINGGPHFAQTYERVSSDDLKVYVIGEEVFVVRRHVPARTPAEMRGELCACDSEIERIARKIVAMFDLDVCGIDMVETSHGPVVVDVNSFPGFIGVPDAARRLADCILARADAA